MKKKLIKKIHNQLIEVLSSAGSADSIILSGKRIRHLLNMTRKVGIYFRSVEYKSRSEFRPDAKYILHVSRIDDDKFWSTFSNPNYIVCACWRGTYIIDPIRILSDRERHLSQSKTPLSRVYLCRAV